MANADHSNACLFAIPKHVCIVLHKNLLSSQPPSVVNPFQEIRRDHYNSTRLASNKILQLVAADYQPCI